MTHEEILTTLGHYVDYLIAGSTAEAPLWNIEKVRSGKPNKWNYIDGCMITACLSLYKTTGDEKFLDFSKKFLDYFVTEAFLERTSTIACISSFSGVSQP